MNKVIVHKSKCHYQFQCVIGKFVNHDNYNIKLAEAFRAINNKATELNIFCYCWLSSCNGDDIMVMIGMANTPEYEAAATASEVEALELEDSLANINNAN